MTDLLQSLGDELAAGAQRAAQDARVARHSRAYHCRCGAPVFFANTQCLTCLSQLGYLPDEGRVAALAPDPEQPGVWRADGRPEPLKCCANRAAAAACNWMLYAANPDAYCIACSLNRTIPDLDDPDNVRYWRALESAKRRLVSQLLAMGLPVRSKLRDPETGVMFDFLRSPPDGPRVMTGHASGLITIDVEEADDAKREAIRHAMHEPYRALLGHFRHEIGHYYWDRLVWDTPWLEPCRALFGDERASYAEAIKRYYQQGPPADWAQHCISAYATMHPWEDWAETWAHYMHIVDSLGVALGYGIDLDRDEGRVRPFGPDALFAPLDPFADRFLELLNAWLRMTVLLNELARSMGQPDFYPFVMSAPVVAKLQFIQMVVNDGRTRPEL